MIFFGILRIKLNFSFRLFHFSVLKACYFSWSKAIGGRKYRRVYFYFLMAFHWSETSVTHNNNYRYTKAAACCLRPSAFNTQVGITEWSENFFHGSTKGHFIQTFKVLLISCYGFRSYCPVDFNDVVLSNSRAILQWR